MALRRDHLSCLHRVTTSSLRSRVLTSPGPIGPPPDGGYGDRRTGLRRSLRFGVDPGQCPGRRLPHVPIPVLERLDEVGDGLPVPDRTQDPGRRLPHVPIAGGQRPDQVRDGRPDLRRRPPIGVDPARGSYVRE